VVSFVVPPVILNKCEGPIVKVTFRGKVAGKGILSDIIKQFKVDEEFKGFGKPEW
jgi:D-methionine transport system ATP-binding protein